ncbi:MAG: DUF1573 domain-containing protein [Chlorobi bacterium]|nr:DUF1573 domain-containing protein [Chlorobiota bacterium]
METYDKQVKNTSVNIEQPEIDMGILEQGKPQTVRFLIHNTGEYPLFIRNVVTSCGCTVPAWPKEPVRPGEKAEIKVTYSAKNTGRFSKFIKVYCNTYSGIAELRIFGDVKDM